MEYKKKKEGEKKIDVKFFMQLIFFLGVMALTFYVFFGQSDLAEIWSALRGINPLYLMLAAASAIFFVAAEGIMIWYLLNAMNKNSGMFQCIGYSFVGFFYSGITPSATGGQPMQLYYMCRDGNRLSDGSVVLMTVAIAYKLVLSVIGICMAVFCWKPLYAILGRYISLYLIGLFLNVLLVALLIFVMLVPETAGRLIHGIERGLVKMHLLGTSGIREEKIDEFIYGYGEAVKFLIAHKGKVLVILLGTFFQRMSVFLLTGFIYLGFHLSETEFLTVVWTQAAIYIAVDMLPVPGAQGITELLYKSVFAGIFPGALLMPSMLAVRGLDFYFLLAVSLFVVLFRMFHKGKRKKTFRANIK